jgi:lipopolysaccharide transport system ATP-binding protein
MASIKTLCKTGILLENGMVKYSGNISDTISKYLILNNDIHSDLLLRKDRKGTQSLIISDCYLLREGKKVNIIRLGETFELCVEISKKSNEFKMDSINLAVNICNNLNQKLIQFCNKFVNYQIIINDNKTYIKFIMNKFPLSPGVYNIRFYMDDSINILDWIENAFVFTIEKGDYYGNGIIEDSAMFNSNFIIK